MKHTFLFLTLVLCMISCKNNNNENKSTYVPISDLQTDFPVASKLDFQPFINYPFEDDGSLFIQDSILWLLTENEESDVFGYCYHLHTGEKLSAIVSRGRAKNELNYINGWRIDKDYIHFYTDLKKTIKSYSIKEIVNNVPLGERSCIIHHIPDSILVGRVTPMDDGDILIRVCMPVFEGQCLDPNTPTNKCNLILFNEKQVKSFQTIDYKSYAIDGADNDEKDLEPLIKDSYAHGKCTIQQKEKIAVCSPDDHLILYTVDLKSGKVLHEKRYSELLCLKSNQSSQAVISNTQEKCITSLYCNNQFIFCQIINNPSLKNKNSKDKELLIFDWQLNPIKRYSLTDSDPYILDTYANTIYRYLKTENGFALEKAVLNTIK